MSVKGKVKRCNERIKQQDEVINVYENEIDSLRTQLRIANKDKNNNKLLENIIKFAITNHVGRLSGGMAIDWFGIDKMSDLKLDIDKNIMEHAYILRVRY